MPRYRVKILRDEEPQSPREDCDCLGRMVTWHRRYKLGEEQPRTSMAEWYEYHENDCCVLLPLYLYDHSGITMSTSPFSCPWDSGKVGYIICEWDKARAEFSGTDQEIKDAVTRCLEDEVKVYDQYLRGEVWGYTVEEIPDVCPHCGVEDSPTVVDSCWGFFGEDQSTNGILECVKHYLEKGKVETCH